MNKKTLFLTLLSVIIGTILGYSGKFLKQQKAAPLSHADPAALSRLGNPLTSASQYLIDSRSKQGEEVTLDKELKHYYHMSHYQLWNELEKRRFGFFSHQDDEVSLLLSSICYRLGKEAPRHTLQQIEGIRGNNSSLQYKIIDVWMMKNPEAAMSYCRENLNDDKLLAHFASHVYISSLSKQSPDKALDYLTTRSLKEQSAYLYEPLSAIVEKTPEKMTETVGRMATVIQKLENSHNEIAQLWAPKDWNAAVQWISTLPEQKKEQALSSAISALPLKESSEKIGLLTGEAKEDALKKISAELFRESPQKAVAWLKAHATEEEAVKVIENNHYDSDTLSLSRVASIEQMPSGAIKDTLLEKTVTNVYPANRDFIFMDNKMEDVLTLVDKIASPEKRTRSLDQALNKWIRKEPENTKSWLEKANIPAQKKEEYMKWCNEYIELYNK